MLDAFSQALNGLMGAGPVLLLLLGFIIGYVFGALPGLGGSAAIALSLPFIFGMNPSHALYFLAAIVGSQTVGGSISAILLNTPGTAVNAATCLDGYPMAVKGEAGKALSVAAISSGAGAVFGLLVLVILLPVVRTIILSFGPPEFFMLCLMGLTVVSVAIRGNIVKGIVSTALGLLFSFIGFSIITGAVRFNFGTNYLWNGIPIIPFFIGLFALGEMFTLAAGRRARISQEDILIKGGKIDGMKEVFINHKACFLRSSVIGTVIGIIPGVGGSIANWVAYLFGKQFSKTPERFGTGWPEGVVASESANNAKDGGALLPTVAFGLPGSAEMVMLLAGLTLLGLRIGPTILLEHLDLVFVLILGVFLSSTIGTLATLFLADTFKRVTMLSITYIFPIVVALCFVGSFVLNQNILDVLVMVIFGILGYVMRRTGFPVVPMVIGYILGDLAENSYYQALVISGGSYAIFFTRPISLLLFISAIFILVYPFIRKRKQAPLQQGRKP